MDFKGQMCTLYQASWQPNAIRPTAFDPGLSVDSFQRSLAAELTKAGLDLRMPVPGVADPNIVIMPTITRSDPGSRMTRYFTYFSGHAVFEVGGQVGNAAGPYGAFYGKGVRRWGWYGGESLTLLNDAARMAGIRAAASILALLATK